MSKKEILNGFTYCFSVNSLIYTIISIGCYFEGFDLSIGLFLFLTGTNFILLILDYFLIDRQVQMNLFIG